MVLKNFKGILVYTAAVLALSVAYFIYAYNTYPPITESETFLSEISEGFGEVGLWALFFIYARTLLKLLIGKGALEARILPVFSTPAAASFIERLLCYLNRTHVYVGIATVAVIVLHIVLMGVPLENLFFQAVLVLVMWQGIFGMFLTWRYSPEELKKFSYLVHAQFVTGISLGLFSYFGHLLIDS